MSTNLMVGSRCSLNPGTMWTPFDGLQMLNGSIFEVISGVEMAACSAEYAVRFVARW